MLQQLLAFDALAKKKFQSSVAYVHRHCYQRIDDASRIVGITGLRWVGKSSYLMWRRVQNSNSVYISCDLDFINEESFLETLVSLHTEHGVDLILLDEIHFLHNRSGILKNLYDFTWVKIVYSWSSMIHLLNTWHDLSRRAIQYLIPIFSYREFLIMQWIDAPEIPYSIQELQNNAWVLSRTLSSIHTKQQFSTYLTWWQFGYFQEEEVRQSYQHKLGNSLKKSLYEDISQFYSLKTTSLPRLEKVLYFLAHTSSSKVNYQKLATMVWVDNKTIVHYLELLKQLGWIYRIDKEGKLSDQVRKQQKIYFSSTNIIDYLVPQEGDTKQWSMRESFTVSMLHLAWLYEKLTVTHQTHIDFVVRVWEMLTHREVWWPNKSTSQWYAIVDDITFAEWNKIPLWLLWFLG